MTNPISQIDKTYLVIRSHYDEESIVTSYKTREEAEKHVLYAKEKMKDFYKKYPYKIYDNDIFGKIRREFHLTDKEAKALYQETKDYIYYDYSIHEIETLYKFEI